MTEPAEAPAPPAKGNAAQVSVALPAAKYHAFQNPLGQPYDFLVWLPPVLAILYVVGVQRRNFSSWLSNRVMPCLMVVFAFGMGLVVTGWGGGWLVALGAWRDANGALITHAPDVSAPDLLTNLLTLSALVASSGFAYLCLPTDRVEERMEAFTRRELSADLETANFQAWYEQAPKEKREIPAAVIIDTFLHPMRGVGGWHTRFTVEQGRNLFGDDTWDTFSKYVDQHIDDSWVRILCTAIGIGMIMGLACLFYRYVSVNDWIFHPIEFGVITLLTILDFETPALLVSLVAGVHRGELAIRKHIKNAVENIAPDVKEFTRRNQQERLAIAQKEAAAVKARSSRRRGARR